MIKGWTTNSLLWMTLAIIPAGCANTLAFGTATKFGLDISQRPDQTVDVVLGYDRLEIASIPTSKDTDASDGDDAYSVLGTFSVRHGNPWRLEPLQLNQFFATGQAARKAAKDPNLQQFFGLKAAELSQKEDKQ